MRRRLPPGVRMYTRRRLQLRRADRRRRAGAFRCAARHLRRDRAGRLGGAVAGLPPGDEAGFHDILAPTVPLSRLIFAAPTRFYKTGIVFLAWLNGHQDHFTMVGGQESARSILHLAEVFRLADRAKLFSRPGARGRRACAALPRRPRDRLSDARPLRRRGAQAPVAEHRDGPQAGRPRSQILEAAQRHGISCVSPWRDQVAGGMAWSGPCRLVRDGGFRLSGYCRGGMFPADPRASRGDARRQPPRRRRSGGARRAVPGAGGRRPAAILAAGLGAVERHRRGAGAGRGGDGRRSWTMRHTTGVALAIEPLHPMYAADRACVNTLGQALDICDRLDPRWRAAARRRRRRLSRLVGPRCLRPDRARRRRAHPRLPHLRLAGADPRPAARPRHDGRRRDRNHKAPRRGRGAGLLRAPARWRSSRTTGGRSPSTRCSPRWSSAIARSARLGSACSRHRSSARRRFVRPPPLVEPSPTSSRQGSRGR